MFLPRRVEDGFDWNALIELLRDNDKKLGYLVSFGDGWVSNGHWAVKAPRVTGPLKIRCRRYDISDDFDQDDNVIDVAPAIDFTKCVEGWFAHQGSYIKTCLSPDSRLGSVYVIMPHEITLKKDYVDRVLRCFQATVWESNGLTMYVSGQLETVYFVKDSRLVAMIMPVRPFDYEKKTNVNRW